MYIAIEGMDGSGKSTLAQRLVEALRVRPPGRVVRQLRFPGYASPVGGLIEASFRGGLPINPDALLWLFAAEARDVEPQIERHLASGDWVVSDRYTPASALIYQTPTHGRARVTAVIEAARLRLPDRLYILDVPPEVALARRRARTTVPRNELYESEQVEQLAAMRAAYRALVFPWTVVLDGTKSTEEILLEVWSDLGLAETPP